MPEAAPHTTDLDLTPKDLAAVTSPDALVGFLSRLGYDTGVRMALTPEAIGLAGESAARVRSIELLAEDGEGFFRVVFVQIGSLTATARNDLARVLGRSTVDHLLVLTSDFSTLEFVVLDKRKRESRAPGQHERIHVVPLVFAVDRKSPEPKDVRTLRRLTWTSRDGLEQFDKLRNVLEAAAFTEEHFCNRALFADHFLLSRLRDDPAWQENPTEAFRQVQSLLRDHRARLTGKGEQIIRDELYEPLFELLGFKAKANKSARDGRTTPDYILKPTSGNGKTAAFVYAWDRWLDGPDFFVDQDTPEENPGACVVTALEKGKADWIIVTNGRRWRLYSRAAHSRATNFYEVDLIEALVSSGDTDPNEAFRYWWLFFRAEAFASKRAVEEGAAARCWLDTVAEGSRDYAKRLGERLKARVFGTIFPHLAQGFLQDRKHRLGSGRPAEEELRDTYEATLTLLYRLLFLLYAEARDLLPIREDAYRQASLKRIKDEIAEKAGSAESEVAERLAKAYSAKETTLYDRFTRLCEAMDRGDPALNVPTYNGGLFLTDPPAEDGDSSTTVSREQRIARFLAEHKVPDRYLALAIDRLARDPDEKTLSLVSIDYKSLEVRHLGSIYEGLLEFKLRVAEEDLTTKTEKKREKYIPLKKAKPRRGREPEVVVRRGGVYLSNDKAERKASGSYYTPDPIVEYIVEHTVGPVLDEKLEKLRSQLRQVRKTFDNEMQKATAFPARKASGDAWDTRELASRQTYLAHRKLVDEMFAFRALDPAMGSGHFLVEAVDFITDRMLTFLNQFPVNPVTFMLDQMRANILEALGEQGVAVDPEKLTEVNLLKRHVLKRCIYGVDLNPMAVELAKVSLWLDAFTIGAPLSFLDHHLRCGNSLLGATFKDLEDAIRGQLFGIDYEPLLRAIRHVLQVNRMADATAAEARQSADEYGAARRNLSGYKIVLDLLLARHFGFPDAPGLLQQGQDLELSSRTALRHSLGDLNELALVEQVEQLAQRGDLRFFHWEIEFPEVFFDFEDANQRRIKHKDRIEAGTAGFDAVVGNPPYDVLAEKELGVDLKDALAYFRTTEPFPPAIKGKQNLYKLFICRGVQIAHQGGALGQIVPMSLLGDEQSSGVRKMLLSETSFRFIEAFPQKDDPANRVFEEAKLSTCIFVTSKTCDDEPFRARSHPGKRIAEDSASLCLRRSDPSLYDPENQPIVSCSQADWDLVIRIIDSGRMIRLGTVCEAFQGEVNEAVNTQKGNISTSPSDGPQILRGSSICLYVVRDASQGEPIYLRKDKYLNGKREDSKAWHHLQRRVGVQESSPQNNFRRIIAALIPKGQFCNHEINYFPEDAAAYPLGFIAAILNSKLADWHFRLGSTNAAVSHYQLYNLPFPTMSAAKENDHWVNEFKDAMTGGEYDKAYRLIEPKVAAPPFNHSVVDCIVAIVNQISKIEQQRGTITRAQRSKLSPEAQPLQDLLDRIIYRMAGLTHHEARGLEQRLATML